MPRRKPRPPATPETRAKLSAANAPGSIQRRNLNQAFDNPGETQQIGVRIAVEQVEAFYGMPERRSVLIRRAVTLFLKFSAANPPDSVSRQKLNQAADNPDDTEQISVRIGIDQLEQLDAMPESRSVLIRRAIQLFLNTKSKTNAKPFL